MSIQAPFHRLLSVFILAVFFLTGCQNNTSGSGNSQTPGLNSGPVAQVFFAVTLPGPLLNNEAVFLSVLDEVTGLALNPTNYQMQKGDDLHYYLALPFTLNSVVKYRYFKQAQVPVNEFLTNGRPVRYRLYYVGGPGEVMDYVSSWGDAVFSGSTGRVTGRVVDAVTGKGLADLMVNAGGFQTLTDSSGDFSLEGLVEGTHNLVVYSLDGSYQPFQQGAKVINGKRTPVQIQLNQANLVTVVFTVSVPKNTLPSVPIRLAGNLYQLGNSFGDLQGGMSSVVDRMPVLVPTLDGKFMLTLTLPAGTDLAYKYTLGDGFWNAEHSEQGNFVLRHWVIPQGGGSMEDVVQTWQSGSNAPILFEVQAPPDTPAGDAVSIQFNPYGWTEPLPMWSLGNNRWIYQLYGPMNMLGSFEYRYCRNEQCGSADDLQTSANAPGRVVSTSQKPQDLKDAVTNWSWLAAAETPTFAGVSVKPRQGGFLAGVEMQNGFQPSWQARYGQAFHAIQNMGSNLVVLTPSWTMQDINPFVLLPLPGQDPLSSDIDALINQARASQLMVALFPQVEMSVPVGEFWAKANRDDAWWQVFFARYRSQALYNADLAARDGVEILILGGDWLMPAYPGGTLADGSSSHTPAWTEVYWSGLVAEIRQHYKGQIYWALPFPEGVENAPGLINELDGIYLLWNAPLADSDQSSLEQMQTAAGGLLDDGAYSLSSTFQKPVFIAAAYPSITGTAKACIPVSLNGCREWQSLNQPQAGINPMGVNLQAQSDVLTALLNTINERNWVAGFISRGFYPPVVLQDTSASVRGKPAEAMLRYWFTHWRSIVQ